jgi:hypothetical protein
MLQMIEKVKTLQASLYEEKAKTKEALLKWVKLRISSGEERIQLKSELTDITREVISLRKQIKVFKQQEQQQQPQLIRIILEHQSAPVATDASAPTENQGG